MASVIFTFTKDDLEAFKALYDAKECGYNEYIVLKDKTLAAICKNDSTFEQDFSVYLKAFDDVLKQLLGIEREKTDQKFLNMDGIVAELLTVNFYDCVHFLFYKRVFPRGVWLRASSFSSPNELNFSVIIAIFNTSNI